MKKITLIIIFLELLIFLFVLILALSDIDAPLFILGPVLGTLMNIDGSVIGFIILIPGILCICYKSNRYTISIHIASLLAWLYVGLKLSDWLSA